MIAIIDYGMGNLRSVQKAFQHIGQEAVLTRDTSILDDASHVVLPGVGAFGDAMDSLRALDLIAPIQSTVQSGRPFLGICVGLQLLFEESEEMGRHAGLGIFPGKVVQFRISGKVPHIGWNQIHRKRESPLLAGVPEDGFAYFVHSYYVVPSDPGLVLATTDYEIDFVSVAGRQNVFGIQFHPEKSQDNGLRILKNFAEMNS
ncbi:MAG: imidazole glycerol phosphate synthase subunit HisH [Chloroflexi bacterium]|nr:imidazole glycerol phosphate synthase subunit HisH [Chloroflexota bacterium]